jgi:hypothetical protein
MNKTILIDDRVNRQKKHLAERLDELNQFPFLKNISGGEGFEEIHRHFIESDFSYLDKFNPILIHRSAFSVNTRNELIDYLKSKEKKVVFFSGGISGCEISKIGKAELMMINVTQFYSENIFVFLKNNANNLLELAFGNNWQLSIQIDTYEKLILYKKSFKDCPVIKIENDLGLNKWIIEKYFNTKLNSSILHLSNLEEILEELKTDIKQLLQ